MPGPSGAGHRCVHTAPALDLHEVGWATP